MGGLGGFFLGSMFGRMLGGGGYGMGGGMGGGFGILPILLIGGAIFLFFRYKRNRAAPAYGGPSHGGWGADPYGVGGGYAEGPGYEDEHEAGPVYRGPDIGSRRGGSSPPTAADPGLEGGLAKIGESDASFSREKFLQSAREDFLRFQRAWVDRDLSPVRDLLDKDIYEQCSGDIEALRRERRINRLDDIDIRRLEAVEAWQEEGFDFITVLYNASVLDYVVSETGGDVLEGSRTEPVVFTEHWTWARRTGSADWFLSAIEQA